MISGAILDLRKSIGSTHDLVYLQGIIDTASAILKRTDMNIQCRTDVIFTRWDAEIRKRRILAGVNSKL